MIIIFQPSTTRSPPLAKLDYTWTAAYLLLRGPHQFLSISDSFSLRYCWFLIPESLVAMNPAK